MIIDKKGKLFGKINIIDLLLIIVLVAAIGIFGYKYISKDGGNAGGNGSVNGKAKVTFYTEEVSDFVVDGTINIGDPVIDVNTSTVMGTIVDVKIEKSHSYAADAEGKYILSEKPEHSAVTVVIESDGAQMVNGIKIGSNKYYIGHSMTITAGRAKMYLRVSDIEF